MAGRVQAEQLVQLICDDHGYVPPEVFDRMSEKDRQIVIRALRKKDEQAGWSIMTLAKNIYSSNARFVFELLQNCDDNHYSRAKERGEVPRVSFKVFSDRIVMRSNEDGFTDDNLQAICSVGKSSKQGAQGYIGEKGIGFKSVFMAAHEVRIQSGDFSFSFQHRKTDMGLGMITPIWKEHDESIPHDVTTFTMRLHGDDAPSEEDLRIRTEIRKQFESIHDAILLFMKNLQRIEISFCDEHEHGKSSVIHSISWRSQTKVTVEKTVEEAGNVHTSSHTYHITRYSVTGLAPNENRTYSQDEKETEAYSRSEIVLAFPLDANSSPVVENQWVFAFLPIRQMGFKFLIQADFVTEANRQDIVTSSQRNKDLAIGIADAFIEAALQFCSHETLQYQWMRYIPQKDAYAWDSFWSSILDHIGRRIGQTKLLRTDHSRSLELPSSIQSWIPSLLDKDGKFLLPGFAKWCASLGYQRSDLALMKPYGIQTANMNSIRNSVAEDTSGSVSVIRTIKDEDWHERLARLLHIPFERGWKESKLLKTLVLIPLSRGDWRAALVHFRPVYFANVDIDANKTGLELYLPSDLNLDVVDPSAPGNDSRRRLFSALGVEVASVQILRHAIFQRYKDKDEHVTKLHLELLYKIHSMVEAPYGYEQLQILSNHCIANSTFSNDYYIPDENPYGPEQLLRTVKSQAAEGERPPVLEVDFVHGDYFEQEPGTPPGTSLSWKAWLHDYFEIRRQIRVVDLDEQSLSDIARHIAIHRPDKFVGLVQHVWHTQIAILAGPKREKVLQELRNTSVLCTDGSMEELNSTFVQTKHLKCLCDRFMRHPESFPWLKIDVPLDGDDFPLDWADFTQAVGARRDESEPDNIRFLLHVLHQIIEQNPDAESLQEPWRVCRLYIFLQAEASKADKPDQLIEWIRKEFASKPAILIPAHSNRKQRWEEVSTCVWDAPIAMFALQALGIVYRDAFKEQFTEEKTLLAQFFSRTLQIPNANWEDVVEDIKYFKTSSAEEHANISRIYETLGRMTLSEAELETLRSKFEEQNLICGYNEAGTTWYKSSKCLWASATRISGTLVLDKLYPDLGHFFLERLNVKELTADMVYKKLLREKLTPEEGKQTILTFNSFLAENMGNSFDPAHFRGREILPVRESGRDVRLVTCDEDFALLDRQSLGNDFARSAAFLDFSINEIRSLRPFLAWADLEGRYLSSLVKEITSVDPDSTRSVSMSHRNISGKAHALLSIAIAYNSPRTRQDPLRFHALLKGSQTLQTDCIRSELHLHQNGKTHRVEKEKATLHIHETQRDGLTVYIPKDKGSQEFCFSTKLPQMLCEWMLTHPETRIAEPIEAKAISAVQSVLAASPIAFADILDHHGIPLANAPRDEYDASDDEADSDTETLIATNSFTAGGNGGSGGGGGVNGYAPRPFSTSSSSFSNFSSFGSASSPQPRPDVGEIDPDQYTALLEEAVNAARQTNFPARGTYDMSSIQAVLGEIRSGNRPRSPNPLGGVRGLNRDRHIGAAGELYVFELLSNLSPTLPGFDRANWQSTIRYLTHLHPDYTDIGHWSGTETSDIVYDDASGALTSLLIDKGYLRSSIWEGAKLKYFLEVKASTGPCEYPFYVSHRQYERMQRQSNKNAQTRQTSELYVIFRVFNLGKEDCAVRVLVDPEALRQREELAFTVDTWAVVTK